MDQAVDLAREKNLRVKAADADARAMDSMRREALAPFWPQLSANGYFNNQALTPNVFTSAGNTMARNYQVFNANQTKDANVTAMYPLFSGGRDYYGYQAAARRAEAGREMRRGTEVDVAMQARLDYIAALREAENVRVTGDLAERRRGAIARDAREFEAGRVPRFYQLRDEAEHANAVQMDAMARSRADQALVALKTTLGVDLSSSITLADRLEFSPRPRLDRGGHPSGERGAPRHHGRHQAAGGGPGRGAGRLWQLLPAGGAELHVRRAVVEEPERRLDDADGYSVGVVVTLPLFDGFLRENALNTAKAKLDRAGQAEGLARQQIAKDVNQAALMLAAAEKSVEASRKGLDQAEEEFRIVKDRFESGRGIQLEILDAQVSVTRARFNAVSALAEYNSAQAMWLRATGRVR